MGAIQAGNVFTVPVTLQINAGVNMPDKYAVRLISTGASGCLVHAPVVYILPEPSLNLGVSGSCLANGEVSASTFFGTPPYLYEWTDLGTNTVVATTQVVNLVAGTYSVVVTDAAGCQNTANVDISPSTINGVITDNLCQGDFNGLIDVTATGVPPLTYSWTGPGFFNPDDPEQPLQTNLASGEYAVDVTDGNGCTQSQSFTVIALSDVIITGVQVTAETCSGNMDGSILVNATGQIPLTYTWTGPGAAGNTTNQVTNLGSGLYSVVIADANACSETIPFSISSNALNVEYDIQNLDCAGNTVNAILNIYGGTPPYSVVWNDGINPSITSQSILNTSLFGNYTVQVTDANNCVQTINVPLFADPVMIINGAVTFDDCLGDIEIILTGGSSFFTAAWTSVNTGFTSTELNITGLVADTYSLTVTDPFALFPNPGTCQATANFVVPALPPPPAITTSTIVPNSSCMPPYNGSIAITVTGGLPPYTYEWTGPNGFAAATQGIAQVEAGTYSVNITDANNCEMTSIFVVPADATFGQIQVTPFLSGGVGPFFPGLCHNRCEGSIYLNVIACAPIVLVERSLDGGPWITTTNFNLTGGLYEMLGIGLCFGESQKTFAYRFTDGNSFSAVYSVTVTPNMLPQAPLINTVSTNNIDCLPLPVGQTASITVSGGYSPIGIAFNDIADDMAFELHSGFLIPESDPGTAFDNPLDQFPPDQPGTPVTFDDLQEGCYTILAYNQTNPGLGFENNCWVYYHFVVGRAITLELDRIVHPECDGENGLGGILINVATNCSLVSPIFEWEDVNNPGEVISNEQSLYDVPAGTYQVTASLADCEVVEVYSDLAIPVIEDGDPIWDSGPAGDGVISINTNTTTSGQILHFDDMVQVRHTSTAAITWSIDNSLLRFGPDAGIVVSSVINVGDNISVINQTKLTSLCNSYWQGLEIRGNHSTVVNNIVNGEATFNNATIEYASTGVKCQTTENSNNGGVISITESTFLNNTKDVELLRAATFTPLLQLSNNLFNRSTFLLTEDYFDATPPQPRINFQNVRRLNLRGITLENHYPDFITAPSGRPVGIYADNGQFNFQLEDPLFPDSPQNIITGFSRGIFRVNAANAGITKINSVEFSNYRDVYIKTDNSLGNIEIRDCTFSPFVFQVQPTLNDGFTDNNSDNEVTYGLYCLGCQGGQAMNEGLFVSNEVNKYLGPSFTSMGLIANNCGPINNRVMENFFHGTLGTGFETEKMDFAVVARNINRNNDPNEPQSLGLHLTCNTFANNEEDIVIVSDENLQNLFNTSDPSLPQYGIRRWQGSNANPPKNDFLESVGTSDVRNDLSYDNGVTVYIPHNYYILSTNPQENSGELINVDPIPTIVAGTPCTEVWDVNGSELQFLAQSTLNSLNSEYGALVDGGSTESLTNEVINTTYNEALNTYYELMTHSPNLSEKVMIEALDKYELPNILLTEILSSNPSAAKSTDVQRGIANRMVAFDEYQTEMINQGLHWVSQKEQLESELSWWQEVYDAALLHQVNEQLELDNMEGAMVLLSNEWFSNLLYIRADLLIESEGYGSAIDLLEAWPTHKELCDYQEIERQQMINFYELSDEASESGWTSTAINDLQTLSETGHYRAKLAAYSVLVSLGDALPNESLQVPYSVDNRSLALNVNQLSPKFELYPNPADQFTTIESLDEKMGRATVTISDGLGNEVVKLQWMQNINQFVLPVDHLPNGVYCISIIMDGRKSITSKLIVLHK